MTHPLVSQLQFTRSEFQRALDGLNDDDARQRIMAMNCISWNVGHLAWQEQRYFLWFAQSQLPLPQIQEMFRYGAPASQPALTDMWSAWETITKAAGPWLDSLTAEKLLGQVMRNGKPTSFTFGSLLQRTVYHYWYHIGENMAIRQMLGHSGLPEFVGKLDEAAPYRPG